MSQTPHDALFKFAFSQVEHAAGVIRSVLPAAVVERLDFSTLTLRPGSFVDAKGVLMRYYQRVSKLTADELELLIRTAAGDAKTEGRIEGELIGERRLLRRLLTTRFGDLPVVFATRLDAATREELETWAERLLSANTLAEIFGDA